MNFERMNTSLPALKGREAIQQLCDEIAVRLKSPPSVPIEKRQADGSDARRDSTLHAGKSILSGAQLCAPARARFSSRLRAPAGARSPGIEWGDGRLRGLLELRPRRLPKDYECPICLGGYAL